MRPVLANDPPQVSDRDLILQCQKGNTQAFRQVYQRYSQRVRSTLYPLCGAPFLDDLTQEVFLKAWKGLPQLRQVDNFSTWLYRISWNVAIDWRRKLAQQRQEQIKPVDNEELTENRFASDRDTPNLLHLHYQDVIQRGLQSLDFDRRAVLILCDIEDVPQKEVAQILKIPIGTVKSRLFHARKSLRMFLDLEGVSL